MVIYLHKNTKKKAEKLFRAAKVRVNYKVKRFGEIKKYLEQNCPEEKKKIDDIIKRIIRFKKH